MPFLLSLAAGVVLVCPQEPPAEQLAERIRDLREEVRALEILRRARPDASQAAWMLHAARFLARERSAIEARRASVLAEQKEAYRRFFEEDERDEGFTPEVEQAAAVASLRLKEATEEYERCLARITNAVREVLSPAQQDAVEGRTARRGMDRNRPPATVDEVMSLLLRVRCLPEVDFRRREGQLASFALRSPGVRPRSPGVRDGEEREELIEAMRRFRAAKEEDLPEVRDRIVEAFFPGLRAHELQKQMIELRKVEDELPGQLGLFLESRVAVPALEALLERLRGGRDDPEAGEGSAVDPRPAPPGDDRRDRDRDRPVEEKPR